MSKQRRDDIKLAVPAVLAAVIVLSLAYIVLAGYNRDAAPGVSTNGWLVKLENSKASYPQNGYVKVKLSITNNTGKTLSDPFYCDEGPGRVYVDGVLKIEPKLKACPAIFVAFQAGSTDEKTFTFNPQALAVGRHNLKIEKIDGAPSNSLYLNITPAKTGFFSEKIDPSTDKL